MSLDKFKKFFALVFVGGTLAGGLFLNFFSWGLQIEPVSSFLSPSWNHLLGTDSLGRDLLARILQGSLYSCFVATAALLISAGIALLFGVLAGWNQGFCDRIFMRFTDLLLALPNVLLAAVVGFYFVSWGFSDIGVLVLVLAVTRWMALARQIRARVLELRSSPFIEAAVALGSNHLQLFRRHLIPHLGSFLKLNVAIQFPVFLTLESFLSFIGIGIQSPGTSWGLLIGEGWKYMSTLPYLILAPSAYLFLFLLSLKALTVKRLDILEK